MQDLLSRHESDSNGNPAGGLTTATGLEISWQNGQNGPLGRDSDRKEPNGCFVETVIMAAISRLNYYQEAKFACSENREAIVYLQSALQSLKNRTLQREARSVEGTHEV